MCRIVLPGGRDPQQPCGLCAGAEIALDGGAHNPFSYLPVATCASRQTSPRKISIRFWLTGWRLKNKKICATPPYQVQPTRGPAHPPQLQMILVRIQPRRGGQRGQCGQRLRAPRLLAVKRCGSCGQFFGRSFCGQCGQFVFGCPHCPQIGGRGRFVGHVGQMVTEKKSERAQQNARQPLRAVCLYSSISFLT